MRGNCGLTALVVLFLSAGFLGAAPDRDAPDVKPNQDSKAKELIVGKWEITDKTQTGTIEFQKDGDIVVTLTNQGKVLVTVKGRYKFTADDTFEVEITPPIEGAEKLTQKVKITKINKDELLTKDDKGKEDKFKRVKEQ